MTKIPLFKNKALLLQAFTHSSYTHECSNSASNYERLEFLGDSIIEFVVRDLLYELYPYMSEGEMSKLRIDLVNESRLANIAVTMDIPAQLRLGVSASDARNNPRVQANAFEALIGAYRLDTDIETVYQFTRSIFYPLINQKIKSMFIDPISELQKYVHKNIGPHSPTYQLLMQIGPDHQPEFQMAVSIKGKIYGIGKGNTKKEAKKEAAINALENLEKNLVTSDYNLLTEKKLSQQKVNQSNVDNLSQIVMHIKDKNRHDDFWELANTLKPADELLLLMKQQIDMMVARDRKLQQLIIWINQKSHRVNLNCPQSAVRAFYLAIIRVLGLFFINTIDPNVNVNFAKIRNLIRHFKQTNSLINDTNTILTIRLTQGLDPAGIIAHILAFDFEPELKVLLQEFQLQILILENNINSFEKWRQDNGQIWIERLITAIGYNLQFSTEEKETLKQYYYAHNLLIKCLNRDSCEVTGVVRQQIEDSLLLPITN